MAQTQFDRRKRFFFSKKREAFPPEPPKAEDHATVLEDGSNSFRNSSFRCYFSTSISRYLTASSHSSWISSARALTSLRQLASFGKMRTMCVLRFSSWLRRSSMLVDFRCL